MFGTGIGTSEILLLAIVAIILYGRNLPSVARSWGQKYSELRRTVSDLKNSIDFDEPDSPTNATPSANGPEFVDNASEDDFQEPTAPRMLPPPPVGQDESAGQ